MKALASIAAVIAASSLALAPARAADTWQIDPAHSGARFSVTHLMISTVRGEFTGLAGTIEFDGKDPASIKADVTIDASTIGTHNDYRDKDLKSDHFFDVAKFPTITFKSKRVVPGAAGTFKLVGDLTMHGVTKEVTLDGTGPSQVVTMKDGARVAASATTTVKRMDYGIKWDAKMDGGGLVVSDDVAITIDIEAKRPAAGAPAAPPKK